MRELITSPKRAGSAELRGLIHESTLRLEQLRSQAVTLEAAVHTERQQYGRHVARGSGGQSARKAFQDVRDELEGVTAAIPILEAEIEALRSQLEPVEVQEAIDQADMLYGQALEKVDEVATEFAKALSALLPLIREADAATEAAVRAERRMYHLSKRPSPPVPQIHTNGWQQHALLCQLLPFLRMQDAR